MNLPLRHQEETDHHRKYLRGNAARQTFTEIRIDPVAQSAIRNEDFSNRFDENFIQLNGREKESTLLLADLRLVKNGEVILEAGEVSENIFIVAKGEFSSRSNGSSARPFLPGDVFGETSFLTGGAESRHVVASSDGELLSIDLKILKTLVRNDSFYHGRLSECLTKSLQRKWRS